MMKKAAHKLIFVSFIALSCLSITLLLFRWLSGTHLHAAVIYTFASAWLGLAAGGLCAKYPRFPAVAVIFVYCAIAAALLAVNYNLLSIISAAAYAAVFAMALRAWGLRRVDEYSHSYIIIGILGMIAAWSIAAIAKWNDLIAYLRILMWVYVPCMLLSVNIISAIEGFAPRNESTAPRQLLRGNFIIGAAGAAAVTLLMLIPQIIRAIIYSIGLFIKGVFWTFNFLGSLLLSTDIDDVPGSNTLTSVQRAAAAAEDTHLGLFETLIMGIAAFALLIIAVRLLGKLVAQIARFINWLMNTFSASRQKESGYIDEVETLVSWKETRDKFTGKFMNKLKRLFYREPGWNSLSNRERVRRAFRDAARRQKDKFINTKTARENIDNMSFSEELDREQLKSSYDAARYSQRDISDEEAQNARNAMHNA